VKILKNHPIPAYFHHLNLGLIYNGLREYDAGKYELRMIRQFQKYLEIAPYEDETYTGIKEMVDYYEQLQL
jgi:hypothetical protein